MANITSIQNKLNKAWSKIGKTLGYKFEIYRSPTTVDVDNLGVYNPLHLDNWVARSYSSFTLSDGYETPQTYGLPTWKIYTQFDNIQVGDILVNETINKTFVIISKDPLFPPYAVEANNRITIKQPQYPTSGEYTPTQVTIASSVPANVQISGGGAGDSTFVPAASDISVGIIGQTYYFWMPKNTVKNQYTITDDLGNEAVTISTFFYERGYVVRAINQHVDAL